MSIHDTPSEINDISLALTTAVLEQVAPEEIQALPFIVEEMAGSGRGGAKAATDHPLGFGLDLTLIAPYALTISGSIVTYLATLLSDAAGDVVKPAITRRIRQLLHLASDTDRREPSHQGAHRSVELTPDDLVRVRAVALEQALALGMPSERSAVLADAFVGAIANPARAEL